MFSPLRGHVTDLPTTGIIITVKIVFIYHVLFGVRCHRVVNKGCRLSPSASVAVPAVSIHRTEF